MLRRVLRAFIGPLLILAVMFVPPLRHAFDSGANALGWALGRSVNDTVNKHLDTSTTAP